MREEHEIIGMVYAAKEDNAAADILVEKYLPFIRAETAKYINRIPQEGRDDELSIAMFAFYEAALSYEKGRGAFLPYAARGIKNRLIDYSRKEARHRGAISLDAADGGDDDRALIQRLGDDNVHEHMEGFTARDEILLFTQELAAFGLSMADIADNCPKQERTLAACRRALAFAREDPEVFRVLLETKKLPLAKIAEGAGIERKTLERHRKYVVAILLAFTNGFEIIRGHLTQAVPMKGGAPV